MSIKILLKDDEFVMALRDVLGFVLFFKPSPPD